MRLFGKKLSVFSEKIVFFFEKSVFSEKNMSANARMSGFLSAIRIFLDFFLMSANAR